MKLNKLAVPFLCAGLAACDQGDPIRQDPNLQEYVQRGDSDTFLSALKRRCIPINEKPQPGRVASGNETNECLDDNRDGLVDLIINSRDNVYKECINPQGYVMCK